MGAAVPLCAAGVSLRLYSDLYWNLGAHIIREDVEAARDDALDLIDAASVSAEVVA
jgi:hypothetical protein